MNNKLYIAFLILSSCLVVSCNDFLDEVPDNRTEVDTPEKITKLLVTGYPNTSYAFIAEMASDNTDVLELAYEYIDLQRELFEWRDVSSVDFDTPFALWANNYDAIASANVALKAIEKLGDTEDLAPQKGEALLCRAYGHFNLVNVFCLHYGKNSSSDLGVPYMTEPETTVRPRYERGTVAGVYERIREDLEAGLPLIDDNNYDVPKYHFNKRAAYAFAARFYLYIGEYDKVIEYANLLLGSNPASLLMNWGALGAITPNGSVQPDYFIQSPAALMLISSSSQWALCHGPHGVGRKYGHFSSVYSSETTGAATPWGNLTDMIRQLPFMNLEAVVRIPTRKIGNYFEYIDQVAGIGYPYIMYPAFVTDETLLCRAEAYIMKGDYAKAVADMNTFMTGFANCRDVSLATINSFYNSMAYYTYDKPTSKKKLNPEFTIAPGGDQENLIHAVLMLRRVLTIHEGLRWFDIKRYGIEISRRSINVNASFTELDVLKKDDPRRAIQIPADVIDAGLTPNPR